MLGDHLVDGELAFEPRQSSFRAQLLTTTLSVVISFTRTTDASSDAAKLVPEHMREPY